MVEALKRLLDYGRGDYKTNRGCSSAGEQRLCKAKVAGSNPAISTEFVTGKYGEYTKFVERKKRLNRKSCTVNWVSCDPAVLAGSFCASQPNIES